MKDANELDRAYQKLERELIILIDHRTPALMTLHKANRCDCGCAACFSTSIAQVLYATMLTYLRQDVAVPGDSLQDLHNSAVRLLTDEAKTAFARELKSFAQETRQ